MDKELVKKLRQSVKSYVVLHPTPTSVLDAVSPVIKEMAAAKIPVKEQLKILRDNGLKVSEAAFWAWRKSRVKNQ